MIIKLLRDLYKQRGDIGGLAACFQNEVDCKKGSARIV